jgi:hypothetical protein
MQSLPIFLTRFSDESGFPDPIEEPSMAIGRMILTINTANETVFSIAMNRLAGSVDRRAQALL